MMFDKLVLFVQWWFWCIPSWQQIMFVMKNRRSIMPSKFTTTELEVSKIEKLLECASYAPTHKLTYPWRFIVIEKKSHHRLHSITYDIIKKHYESQPCLSRKLQGLENDVEQRWNNVSHFIGICVKTSHKVPEWEEICAVSCAVQNMLLMAPCLGIAGYWSSWHSETMSNPHMLDFLGMSAENGDLCLGFLVLGSPNTTTNILYERNIKDYQDCTTWL